MDPIVNAVPTRAMAIFSHPGDAEIACGATLARWAEQGCAIALLICTQGDKGSHDVADRPQSLAKERQGEVTRAASLLGVSQVHVLEYLDGEIENDRELRAQLVSAIRAWKPAVVFGHDPTAVFIGSGYVNHRDHREVGFAVCDAVAPAASSPHYFPDAGPPHQVESMLLSGTLLSDAWVDVTDHLETKAAALQCHQTQVAGTDSALLTLVNQRAVEGLVASGLDATEAFRRITFVG